MEMTHLGSATVHHLIACLLRESSEKNHVRSITRGIDRLSLEPPQSPMLVEHRPGHLTQGSIFPLHYAILGAYTDYKTGVQDPSHGKRFRSETFSIPSHCHCELLVWHLCASHLSTSRQDLEQNQTSPPFFQKQDPSKPRVVIRSKNLTLGYDHAN
jgi:hypothetical protein